MKSVMFSCTIAFSKPLGYFVEKYNEKFFLQKPLTNRIEDDIIVKLTHSRTSSKMKMLQKKLKKFEKSVDK